MGELLASPLEVIAVFGLDGVLDGAWSGIVNAQDGALHQLDLSGRIATQASTTTFTTDSAATSRSLSLAPCLGGRGVASGIGRGNAPRDSKGRGGVLQGMARVDGGGGGGIVGIMVGGVGSIGFGQAVTGSRPDGRCGSLV